MKYVKKMFSEEKIKEMIHHSVNNNMKKEKEKMISKIETSEKEIQEIVEKKLNDQIHECKTFMKNTENLNAQYKLEFNRESVEASISTKADQNELRKTAEILFSKFNMIENISSKHDYELNSIKVNNKKKSLKQIIEYFKMNYESRNINANSESTPNSNLKVNPNLFIKRYTTCLSCGQFPGLRKGMDNQEINDFKDKIKNSSDSNNCDTIIMREDDAQLNLALDLNFKDARKSRRIQSGLKSDKQSLTNNNSMEILIKKKLKSHFVPSNYNSVKATKGLPPTFRAINILHKEQISKNSKLSNDYS